MHFILISFDISTFSKMSCCLKHILKSSTNTRIFSRSFAKLKNIKPETGPANEVGKTVFQSLRGRDLLTFDGYTRNDIFSLLWMAHEIKSKQVPSSMLSQFSNTRVGLIWSSPITKASLSHATQQLNASICTFHEDQLSKSTSNFEMLGRCLASATDVMFLDVPSWDQTSIDQFALGSNCPVLVVASKDYSPGMAYTELFTLFLKYGYLRRLVIAAIGPRNNSMLNTYFTLLPTVGMHLRYLVYGGGIENQQAWETGLKLSSRLNTEMKEMDKLDDVLYRAHTISTCFHESPYTNLSLKQIEEMDLDWTFLQYDSFKGLCASKDFLKARDHCLVYDVISNQTWIFQALIACHTSNCAPLSLPPRFEGVD